MQTEDRIQERIVLDIAYDNLMYASISQVKLNSYFVRQRQMRQIFCRNCIHSKHAADFLPHPPLYAAKIVRTFQIVL